MLLRAGDAGARHGGVESHSGAETRSYPGGTRSRRGRQGRPSPYSRASQGPSGTTGAEGRRSAQDGLRGSESAWPLTRPAEST
jgi:hypothetical protein